jgi:hypothetical protein
VLDEFATRWTRSDARQLGHVSHVDQFDQLASGENLEILVGAELRMLSVTPLLLTLPTKVHTASATVHVHVPLVASVRQNAT